MKNVNLYDAGLLSTVESKLNGYLTRSLVGLGVGLHTVKYIDLLKAVATGEIKPYKNNRGTGIINPITVNAVANNLDSCCFGQIKLGRFDVLTVADGHGRIEGLTRRYMAGKLTKAEKNTPLAIEVVPKEKFYDVYEVANSGINHTSKQKLTNPNYMFGSMFVELAKQVGDEYWNEFIVNKFYKQTSYLFYYFSKNTKYPQDVSYVDIFEGRHVTEHLELCQVKNAPFVVSKDEFVRLADGIHFYVDVFRAIDASINENTDKKPLKSLRNSAPFMALVVVDKMSGTHQFGESSVLLARRILRNASELRLATSGLTHSSTGSTRAVELVIKRLLSPTT